jgi:hypothetical protein
LAHNPEVDATSDLFARASQTPVVRSLAQRLEKEGILSGEGIDGAAQPFLAVLLRYLCPTRPIVVVTENLKLQESFQQDVETWIKFQVPAAGFHVESLQAGNSQLSTLNSQLF